MAFVTTARAVTDTDVGLGIHLLIHWFTHAILGVHLIYSQLLLQRH